jgi:hypothetical protein
MKNFLRAQAIAERAGRQNERRECDGVGADHPLQFGHPAAERRSNAVERRVDDGDVELNDAVTEAHRRKRQRFRETGIGRGLHRLGRFQVSQRLIVWRKISHGSIPFSQGPHMGRGGPLPTRFLRAKQSHKLKKRAGGTLFSRSRERDAERERPVVGKSGARSGADRSWRSVTKFEVIR